MNIVALTLSSKRFAFVFAAVAMVLLGRAEFACASHPYHVSRAEIEFNLETNKFQVALCVWPEDLEKAVSLVAKKPVNLDNEDDVEILIRNYVASQFRIVDAEAKASQEKPAVLEPAEDAEVAIASESNDDDSEVADGDEVKSKTPPESFRWIGYEMELKQAWLYFEIDAGDAKAWQIESQLFFELNNDQFNQVQIGNGTQFLAKACEPSSPSVEWSRD